VNILLAVKVTSEQEKIEEVHTLLKKATLKNNYFK